MEQNSSTSRHDDGVSGHGTRRSTPRIAHWGLQHPRSVDEGLHGGKKAAAIEAADYISETARRRFGLKYGEKVARRWWLFE